jgi:8-oxo-dGTP pyrophosphatase MutT (NUDIX family)
MERYPVDDLNHLSLQKISRLLSRESEATEDIPLHLIPSEFYQAAVLIPFIWDQGEWHLLFIRRSTYMDDYHGGQVAFAGGKLETGDADLRVTALREAHEEIGIHPEDVTILGQLNHHHSISRFQITPVVGHIEWPYELTLEVKEVARAFTIPLNWLADPSNHHIKQRQLDSEESFPVVYFDEYDGEILWGATARMTLSLLSLLK